MCLFDVEESQLTKALEEISVELDEFEKSGVLRGTLTAEEQKKLLTSTSKLEECVKVINELKKVQMGTQDMN